MTINNADDLTRYVLQSFDGAKSARFREIMQSAVRHLHSFVREVHLTEAEWEVGIKFLTRTGHICSNKRQEFILLSDTLGVSMQMVNVNNPIIGKVTEATVFGPFFVEGAPEYLNGDDITNGAKGLPCYVEGTISGQDGKPIGGAHLIVWESDQDGFYDSQYADLKEMRNRGQLTADANGKFWFWGMLPTEYPIPYDGPVGDMLKAAGRSPMRPPHLHFMITAPHHRRLITHIFVSGKNYLKSDAVFGVKESLIANFERHDAGVAPDGKSLAQPYYTVKYDFVLASQ